MRTARISDLRRGHLRAEFVPKLRVGSFHRSDSEGCTMVTIERHSSDRLSAGPLYMYTCALHAHRARPLRVFLLYRVDNRIHAYSTRTAPFRASANSEIAAGLLGPWPSFYGRKPSCDSAFYTHANPVAAAGYFLISWITREVKSDQVRVDQDFKGRWQRRERGNWKHSQRRILIRCHVLPHY